MKTRLLGLLVLATVWSLTPAAGQVAGDNAEGGEGGHGWIGANGGFGFEAFVQLDAGGGGTFEATGGVHINGSRSWGIFAGDAGLYAAARPLSNAVLRGQLTLTTKHNVDNTAGFTGANLKSTAGTVFGDGQLLSWGMAPGSGNGRLLITDAAGTKTIMPTGDGELPGDIITYSIEWDAGAGTYSLAARNSSEGLTVTTVGYLITASQAVSHLGFANFNDSINTKQDYIFDDLLIVDLGLPLGTDPGQRYAWGENVGWVNAGPPMHVVTVHFDGSSGWLSGYAWGENVGWLNMGATGGGPYANTSGSDWGVNLDGSGHLSGYAWGENIGWINFDGPSCDAAIDTDNGEFSGHAYGENIGWLKFRGSSPDYGVRSLAFDKQPGGTPNWWLALNGVDESSDEGDGVPAWQEYVADTDPANPASFFQVVSISVTGATSDVMFWPVSTRRDYTLWYTEDLPGGGWSEVPGQVDIPGAPGSGGEQMLEDAGAGSVGVRHYTVEVKVSPTP
jgi:hypothetical protein